MNNFFIGLVTGVFVTYIVLGFVFALCVAAKKGDQMLGYDD